jgi:ADP-ribose pyrophosphatase YjhB (NUDIX family)
MKFCSLCASEVSLTVPQGDHLARWVCTQCGEIHYQNPKVVVGCVPEWEGQILLCRRAIPPRVGFWTMPSGFMENGETLRQGAARETLEEAQARVEVSEEPLTIFSSSHTDQVHMVFRARMLSPEFGPTAESLEVRLFHEHEIPWEDLAFRTVVHTLKHFFADCKSGIVTTHMVELPPLKPQL